MYGPVKTPRDDRYRREKQNPSFSSTLLDEIYRSIDESDAGPKDSKLPGAKMEKKQSNVGVGGAKIGRERVDPDALFFSSGDGVMFSRPKPIRTGSERTGTSLFVKLIDDSVKNRETQKQSVKWKPKNSNFIGNSNNALFFSSGANSIDSVAGVMFSRSNPKPIRTGTALLVNLIEDSVTNQGTQKQSTEAFIKSNHKNSNFIGDSKHPVSPGGRVAEFLNSIFAARSGKKSKDPSPEIGRRVSRSAQSSACSSASSFSRLCLSKHSPAAERSGRFCTGDEVGSGLVSVPARKVEQRRRFEEAARDFLRRYRRGGGGQNDESSDRNDDDGSSCSSSDLFELDHLQVVGCDRYREELLVYETTRFDSIRVIANGLTM